MKITLSVIIPTKERKSLLMACIASLMRQNRPPDQLIIVDQSKLSAEDVILQCITSSVAKKLYVWDPILTGLTAARNLGVKMATGNVLLFLDDDVLLDQNYTRSILSIYEKDMSLCIGGVGGLVTNFKFTSDLGKLSRFSLTGPWSSEHNFWYHKGGSLLETRFLSGCNMSYRKEVFESLMFDERLSGICMGEDLMFSYEVSKTYRLIMTPDAKLKHLVTPISRSRERDLRAMSVISNHYFYEQYVEKTLRNYLSYLLLVVGMAGVSILSLNKERLAGTLEGLLRTFGKHERLA